MFVAHQDYGKCIDIVLTTKNNEMILQAITAAKSVMPFLIRLSGFLHKSQQDIEGCRKPFVEKSLDVLLGNTSPDPDWCFSGAIPIDLALISVRTTVENEHHHFINVVRGTKQLAGLDACGITHFLI